MHVKVCLTGRGEQRVRPLAHFFAMIGLMKRYFSLNPLKTGDNRSPGKTHSTPHSSRLLRALVVVSLVLLFIHLGLQFLNLNVFHQQSGQIYELSNRFDFDDESSVPTWFSQALFLAISAFALLAACLQTKKAQRNFWRLIAFIGVAFSIDEIAGLHERILQSVHVAFYQDASPTGLDNAWWLIAPVLLLAGGWLAWMTIRLLPRRTTLLFVASGVAFLVGAVAVDLITSVVSREWFLNQGVLVAAEEMVELLACIGILYAMADYLEGNFNTELGSAARQLKAAGQKNHKK